MHDAPVTFNSEISYVGKTYASSVQACYCFPHQLHFLLLITAYKMDVQLIEQQEVVVPFQIQTQCGSMLRCPAALQPVDGCSLLVAPLCRTSCTFYLIP